MTIDAPDLVGYYLTIFRPYLEHYGYWTVFGAILLEDFGVPMPGETLLIAGALLAAQGDLSILPLLLVAWTGAVIGDNIGYAIGRFGGHRLVLRYGRYLWITPARLQGVHDFFQRYGGRVVVAARFFALLRQLNGIVAGISDMNWWRFLAYNILGAALWVSFWGLLAYGLGAHLTEFLTALKQVELYLIVVIGVAVGALTVYWLWWRAYRASPESAQ